MRIEKVRIQNLNSLYGIHEIDFTNPAYQRDNLFLICGVTGAGKSTVLDAITLALYGQTPRVGKITEKNGKVVLSQGTRYCCVEVTFSLKGKRYRAHWHIEINRNHVCNKPKRELCDLLEDGCKGEIIENSITGVQNAINERINLDYEQFTKAVLLEQGGFAAFLSAQQDDRAHVLEQLTGTEIYTKLSMMAFERAKEERTKYEHLQNLADSIHLMTEDEYRELLQREDNLKREKEVLDGQMKDINRILSWFEEMDKKQVRMRVIENEKLEYQSSLTSFMPKRVQLELAQRAQKVTSIYENYKRMSDGFRRAEQALQVVQKQLPVAHEDVIKYQALEEKKQSELRDIQKNIELNEPVFKKIRILQTELRARQEQYEDAQKKVTQVKSDIDVSKAKCEMVWAEIEKIQTRLKNGETWLDENRIDETLNQELEAIKGLWKTVQKADESLQKANDSLEKMKKEILKKSQKFEEAQKKDFDAAQNLDGAKKGQEQAIRNYEMILGEHHLDELEQLKDETQDKWVKAKITASYQQALDELKEGEACPLCGSTIHPYKHGAPQVSQIEQELNALSAQIAKIRDAKKKMDEANDYIQKAESLYSNCHYDLELKREALEHIEEQGEDRKHILNECQLEWIGYLNDFNEKIGKYGVHVEQSKDLEEICSCLERRQKTWNGAQEKYKELTVQLQKLMAQHIEVKTKTEEQVRSLDKLTCETDEKALLLMQTQKEIRDLFGDRDVDQEEQKLKKGESDARQLLELSQKKLADAKNNYDTIRMQIEEREQAYQTGLAAKNESECAFLDGLKCHHFETESEFLSAVMDEHDLESLANEARNLDDKGIHIEARYQDTQKEWEALQNQKLTDRNHADVQQDKDEKKVHLEEITKELGAILLKCKEQKDNENSLSDMKDALNKAKIERQRWQALADIIGLFDGKKYREFAQGMTFNILLKHANRYLQERGLMKRYEFVRKNGDDVSLDFLIQDYQTGKVRSAANLSGGEKFCLSLALALGLSEMASKNVNIESLFIDEGLGTLDDQTLDTALTMLKNLSEKENHRLIGLITHVSRAKELITTQIVTEKVGGGHSKLNGPGCRMIRNDETIKVKRR